MFHSETQCLGFQREVALELLKDWPAGYRARTELEHLLLQGASLAREAIADRAIRDALQATSWQEAKAILQRAQKQRIEMP